MRGEVISVDAATGGGLISGEDGARYGFSAASARGPIRVGDRVDFLGLDGSANDVMVLAPAYAAYPASASFASAPGSTGRGYDFAKAMFSFSGRLRRSHYWISWAILFFGFWIWLCIPVLNLLLLLAFPVFLWANLAVASKRFHDMGLSGWLICIPWGLSVLSNIVSLGAFAGAAISDPSAFEAGDPAVFSQFLGGASLLGVLSLLASLGFWLWLGIQDSQPGRNAHGPNPKDLTGDAAAAFS